MSLKYLLDTLPADQRAFVVAECSWSCPDAAVAKAFAESLAASGREAVDEVLGTLPGAARAELEAALVGLPMGQGHAELPPILAASVDRAVATYAAAMALSVALKERARTMRSLLKANFDELEGCITDQGMGVPFPGTKPADPEAAGIRLPPPDQGTLRHDSLFEAIARRHSERIWAPGSISLPELSFLLWATQGLRGGRANLRTVPSGGARHPFETYLAVREVDGVEPGIWRYRALEHDLVLVSRRDDLKRALTEASMDQAFVGSAPLAFVWTAIPARTEWRYCVAAPKIILQDSGHLCQNLYLAAGAVGCGTCAIGAYCQAKMDALVGVDGTDEFVVYAAPVGRLASV
jgi:SagB-type dehydrogenase family enzyme